MIFSARRLITLGALVVALAVPAGASAAGWTAAVPQPRSEVESVDGLMLRPDGTAWLATMVEGEVRVSERRPGRDSFEPTVPAGEYSGYVPDVEFVDMPGEPPLVVWRDSDGGHVSARRDDGSWAPLPGPFGPPYGGPAMVPLADGSMMAVWREGTELRARTRPTGGEFGAPEAVVGDLGEAGDVELAGRATSHGDTVIAWSERDPTPEDANRETLRLVSRSLGGDWAGPVLVDSVTVTPNDPEDYPDAGFSQLNVAAKPGGGWVLASRRWTSHDFELSPGGPSGSDAIKLWDGRGTEVQATRTLDEGTYTASGQESPRRLRFLAMDAAGGTFVWWDRLYSARLSAYRPAGGDFSAPASSTGGRETSLALLGGDRWYRLDWGEGEWHGAARPLTAFAEPLPPAGLKGKPGESVAQFAGDTGGHVLLVSGVPAERSPRMVLYDERPPMLSDIAVPVTGIVGAPAVFSAKASDPWSGAGVEWDFGDGATAKGDRVEHAFALPGRYEVRVTGADLLGNRITETRTVDVGAALPVTGGLPPQVTPPPIIVEPLDRLAPLVTGAKARGRRATVQFSLSEPARADLRLYRVVGGVKRGGKCRTSRAAKRRGGKACRRLVRLKRVEFQAPAGTVERRLSGRRLATGRYRVVVRVRDAAGNAAKRRTIKLKISA